MSQSDHRDAGPLTNIKQEAHGLKGPDEHIEIGNKGYDLSNRQAPFRTNFPEVERQDIGDRQKEEWSGSNKAL